MEHNSLAQLSQKLQKKECSSKELTQYYLNKIKIHQHLNAFISIDEEYALSLAHEADKAISAKKSTPLTGIPMALKDLFCTAHMPTTCASKMLAQFQSPYNATVTDKLLQHGAVLLGKTNMDEFAMGSTNESSHFGPVKNPWNLNHVPGGSSGGSAAAVAADLVPYTLGSDTGGSIRQPAAFCGISGLKPTYGLVSRFGMVAYASSMDQAGPMAHSAEDLSIILQAIAGFDSRDSTSMQRSIPNYHEQLNKPLGSLTIGLPHCFFQSQTDPAIQKAVHETVAVFKSSGAQIKELDLNYDSFWVPTYYVLACAEASSNLSRYDGIRFGHRSMQANSLMELIVQSRQEGFGTEVKKRILTGTHVLSSGYYDAYYLHAQKIRRLIQEELLTALKQVDVILGPTTPTLPFVLGEKKQNAVQNYLADVFTVAANLSGLPALSIPAGFAQGLPIGIQLMGNPYSEALLLQMAHHYQSNTNWHHARPQQ
ncbi:MAG: Asp-tRNA(Asn)/Glu-tRNA(Gln) amidotransferase GatCAB subunit A [Legionella sp.]|nr:MAG: Asp-tRNA(Asn)/Glu-tRNA(Gln) amidotransferase GatCAB subunit A [Legionella sp.]PJD98742.1 MAG: Asp-tRNA(Asn)/Glu-tRNA(Gln) amidotransferase GatCAB subunit A [Legionella sp.]